MSARDQHLVERALDLMLIVPSFLQTARGEKRARLHRAFTGFAIAYGSAVMNEEEGRLPQNERDAALALHRAVIDLCMCTGLRGPELVDHYNEHREGASFGNGGIGEAAERAQALLSIFHARRLVQAKDTERAA